MLILYLALKLWIFERFCCF